MRSAQEEEASTTRTSRSDLYSITPSPLIDWENISTEGPYALRILELIRLTAQDETDSHRWDAMCRLWNSNDAEMAQNRILLRPGFFQVAQEPADPHRESAIHYLWDEEGDQQETNWAMLRSLLLRIAQNSRDPLHWSVVFLLWNSDRSQQPHNRALVRPALVELAGKPGEHQQAARSLLGESLIVGGQE